jgi:NAD(P)-dependent dehydrogenase (short-subunit alcohol dehydrogenase family)
VVLHCGKYLDNEQHGIQHYRDGVEPHVIGDAQVTRLQAICVNSAAHYEGEVWLSSGKAGVAAAKIVMPILVNSAIVRGKLIVDNDWDSEVARRELVRPLDRAAPVVGEKTCGLCGESELPPEEHSVADELLSLAGRVAVVVGGTSGIGKTLALGLAKAGADVVATARRRELVDSVATSIEGLGRRTLREVCDVQDRASLENVCVRTQAMFGKIDILVNCAGKTRRVPTLELDEREWSDILDVNLTGTLRSCQIFGRAMVGRQYGRIINIASLSSFVALYEVAAYAASKAAVASLTKSLAIEWGRHGVCVNAIAPGVFLTELNEGLINGTDRGREFLMRTPMKRFGKIEELVGAAVFLASESASFVNGEVLVVDGGFLASGVNQ